MSLRKVVIVTPLPGHILRIRFDDETEGEVDLSHLSGKGVFKIWDTKGVFASVTVARDGSLRWGDDVDLCADALYERIVARTPADFAAR